MSQTDQCTFRLDQEINRKMADICMELRQRGYKKFSKTALVNSLAEHFIELYEKKRTHSIRKIIGAPSKS